MWPSSFRPETRLRGLTDRASAAAIPGSSFTHSEQHFTFTHGLYRVRHVGLQHEGLPAGKLMPLSRRLDH
jgi:hypothetical protein